MPTNMSTVRMALFCCCLNLILATSVGAELPGYLRDVRPILAANCLQCHGPDEASREAELRLDLPVGDGDDAADSGRVIIPGSPDESELIHRITNDDPDLKMPPADSGLSLTAEQIDILRRWIANGAQYETHWSFTKPRRPAVPDAQSDPWCRSPIDHFILRQLKSHGLEPTPQADPYTLIRRVYLDLIGLPPTPDEADKFAADPSDAAYSTIVDRLLKSPRFGEHWARMWLDLARYADTKGYEKDQPRQMWRYRDWVINALNADMPYDQFTVQQIAGDLLPSATPEQILATAFHRNTMTNDEGGTDNEEFRTAAVKDRVDTTIQVWMGLTMGCAKCHSHKYDPISQREYYQFMAFFNQSEDADRSDDAPKLSTPTPEQKRQLDELNARIAEVREPYEITTPEFTIARRKWEVALAAETSTSEQQQALSKLAAIAIDQRTTEQDKQLEDEYRRVDPRTAPLWKQLSQLEKNLAELRKQIPETPVMKDLPAKKQRETFIHVRGNFLQPGEKVMPGMPAALSTVDKDMPMNRLAVARWLISEDNPLTSRVLVNRIWARLFGRGIVETEEDFGLQGELPVHPELLDWLAVEFRQSHGWSLKELCRVIVESSTYRQSSTVTESSRQHDPDNRFLSRGARFRLPAETVRDQALAAAGLLSKKIGGPSVMPPQPDGIWRTTYSSLRWETPRGENRYRRGIYTFLRRTSPYPSMITFDAGSREVCQIRRIRTNTPLQALVTMNDPVFVEAAGALAMQFQAKAGKDALRQMIRRVLIRLPEDEELARLESLLEESLAEFEQSPESAAKLLRAANVTDKAASDDLPRQAARTVVASVLLNLDETLMRP